jgi:hypothetical protein
MVFQKMLKFGCKPIVGIAGQVYKILALLAKLTKYLPNFMVFLAICQIRFHGRVLAKPDQVSFWQASWYFRGCQNWLIYRSC